MTHSSSVPNRPSHVLLVTLGICLGMTSGCFKTKQVLDADGMSDGGSQLASEHPAKHDAGTGGAAPRGDGSAPASPDGGGDFASSPYYTSLDSICGSDARCVTLNDVDKVDLLFVVDNSNSMAEEQARLRTQFGPLIGALTRGKGAGGPKFTPASLHLGVVSSDMGLPGIDKVEKCMGLGMDGQLLHEPTRDPAVPGCQAQYPKFLSVNPGDDINQPTTDLQCIATLGTDGCGFEQQLEAGLKAVWPSTDDRIVFLGDPASGQSMDQPMTPASPDGGTLADAGLPFGDDISQPDAAISLSGNSEPIVPGFFSLGHGDADNAGFLRDAVGANSSLLAVVVLSDEDDGSSGSVEHLVPKQFLDPNDVRYDEPLNLRNFYHKDELYPVTRYIDGLKALRPESDDLVVFGAIVGAPSDLVDPSATQDVGTNPMVRQAFYDTLHGDSRMQEMVDPSSTTTPGQGSLLPSCSTNGPDGVPNGKAYPPQRFVQVAQGFGANGFVDSLCRNDFGPAIDQLVDRIGARLGSGCLEQGMTRQDTGLVPNCKVLWELPPVGAYPGTPATCKDGGDFLQPAEQADMAGLSNRLCQVTQLPVFDGKVGPESSMMGMNGWYYDDFSPQADLCMRSQRRIGFTKDAAPPTGVRVILDCN